MIASQFAARAGAVLRRRKQSGVPADEPAETEKAARPQSRFARVQALLRQHWLLSVLLAAGLALRVLAEIGYRPALIYVDSLKYLYGASPGSEPLGYKVPLKLLVPFGGLGAVTAVQHLLGLAVAVALYALLMRRGVNRWWAALAVAPVLLDGYQLQMEQMIMPDSWFEAMIVAGLVLLLWRPQITMRTAIAAGLILGASATVRQVGEILIVPLVLFLLVAVPNWWRAVRFSAALAVAFALPVLAYCSFSYARYGHFWLARSQASTGRLVAAADCATLKIPADVRPLCPTPAQQQALGPDALEKSGQSPLFSAPVPPGTRGKLIGELKSAIEHQQPLRVAVSILSDAVRLFAPTRQPTPWVTPIQRWQFQTSYPTYPPWINICQSSKLSAQNCMISQKADVGQDGNQLLRPGGTIIVGVQRRAFGPFRARPLDPSYGGSALVDKPVAAFLHGYQLDGGYTPGPLLALFALAGLGGSVLALSLVLRRRSGAGAATAVGEGAYGRTGLQALGCLLFTGTAAIVLFVPDIFEYSWRYELPAVVTLPPAGVFGICALLSYRKARREAAGQPPAQAAAGSAEPAEA